MTVDIAVDPLGDDSNMGDNSLMNVSETQSMLAAIGSHPVQAMMPLALFAAFKAAPLMMREARLWDAMRRREKRLTKRP
jgi:hypothetical protein